MTTDLGVRNQATARAYRANAAARRRGADVSRQFQTVARRDKPNVEDRYGRRLGLKAPDGRAYSPCPACEQRSMVVVQRLAGGNAHWKCESCHYEDTDERALV